MYYYLMFGECLLLRGVFLLTWYWLLCVFDCCFCFVCCLTCVGCLYVCGPLFELFLAVTLKLGLFLWVFIGLVAGMIDFAGLMCLRV